MSNNSDSNKSETDKSVLNLPQFLTGEDKVHYHYRTKLYVILLCFCISIIIYLVFFDDEDIKYKTKYYNRSDFILKMDESHQNALKEFIIETMENHKKCLPKKEKLIERAKTTLPLIAIISLLKFSDKTEFIDTFITYFIAINIVAIFI